MSTIRMFYSTEAHTFVKESDCALVIVFNADMSIATDAFVDGDIHDNYPKYSHLCDQYEMSVANG